MKHIITLLLISILVPHFAISANPDTTIRKWSVGVSGSLDYTDEYVTTFSEKNEDFDNARFWNNYFKSSFGYTYGLNFLYNYNNKLSIGLGVQYSKGGTQRNVIFYYYNDDDYSILNISSNDTIFIDERFAKQSEWYKYGELPKRINYKYNTIYINVPITVKYKFMENNFRPYVSAGVVPNIIMFYENIDSQIYYDDISIVTTKRRYIEKDDKVNRFNLAMMLSTGFDYKLSNRFTISLEANTRYNIFSNDRNTDIRDYYYFIGLNAGLYYNF